MFGGAGAYYCAERMISSLLSTDRDLLLVIKRRLVLCYWLEEDCSYIEEGSELSSSRKIFASLSKD